MMALLNAGYTQSWDEAGMMKQSVFQAGSPVGVAGTNEYGYDVDRKRAWKKITRNSSIAEHTVYIHAGPNLIAEYPAGTAAASPAQEYVYAQEIDSLVMLVRSTGGGSGNEKVAITRNQQWSVTALTDSASGTVLERYTYDHFGKRTILEPNGTTVRATSSYNMPFGYTSRQHDAETGLMYFRARYFDPATAEFTSPDPLEFVDGMSLFRGYFGIEEVDPFGFYRIRHEWIGESGCYEYCIAAGADPRFCADYCGNRWPPFDPKYPDFPPLDTLWGELVPDLPADLNDGKGTCTCQRLNLDDSLHVLRPPVNWEDVLNSGAKPIHGKPGGTDREFSYCEKDGGIAYMKYQGKCVGKSCDGEGGCFHFRKWRCKMEEVRKKIPGKKGFHVVGRRGKWDVEEDLFTKCRQPQCPCVLPLMDLEFPDLGT